MECDIGKSLLVIEVDEDGVDPITWCSNELEQVHIPKWIHTSI